MTTEGTSIHAIDLAYYLPYGEMLRVFLEQSCIASADLRTVLRARGIFLADYDKRQSVPPLAFATLTPIEFESLLEKQRTRDDTPKTVLKKLPWNSERTLMASIPSDLDLNKLLGEAACYKINADTGFQPVNGNPNHLRREFSVEREDLHKSWTRDRSKHEGSVELEKVGEGKEAKIIVTSTAPETKEVGATLVRKVTAVLKENGDVGAQEQASSVLFADFDNAGRVKFLLSSTAANEDSLRFVALTDYDLAPDRTLTLPRDIEVFLKTVTQLKFVGDDLKSSFFLENVKYHKYILLSRLECKFRFAYHAAAGECIVSFAFAGYTVGTTSASEFEANISGMTVDREFRHVSRRDVLLQVTKFVKDFAWSMIEARTTG